MDKWEYLMLENTCAGDGVYQHYRGKRERLGDPNDKMLMQIISGLGVLGWALVASNVFPRSALAAPDERFFFKRLIQESSSAGR
jgi:hypothetical protein